jgi:hypothetical protein
MSATSDHRFTDLRRLAAIDASLGRLPFLPGDRGSTKYRFVLNQERSAIVARLAGKS